VGNGTADLLWLIGLLYAQRRRVAIFEPTFGEYENVAGLMRASVVKICHPGWTETTAGRYEPAATTVEESAAALAACRPEVVLLCNPNNPTGHWLGSAELERMLAAAPEALWIVDEAYIEFMAQPQSTVERIDRGNLLVLRSMTKDFSLGGLRLGYVLGSPALIAPLQTAQPPWNVNTLAQLAGARCLDQLDWRNKSLAQLRVDCTELRQGLQEMGFDPLSSVVNYFLVPVASPPTLRQALLARKLMVRDCTSFGLPQFIRLATQRPAQNRLLLDALAGVTRSGAPGVGPSSSTGAPPCA
jgi:histidinol-phosphate/aromatic aminotransferase/cobyric acid decarboxylase-like protein